jgi:hypothetical protein
MAMREYRGATASNANREGHGERAGARRGETKRVSDIAHRQVSAIEQPDARNGFAASPRVIAQRSAIDAITQSPRVAQQRERLAGGLQLENAPAALNKTGLPDHLKSGIESLSGFSMDDVRVHYNSSRPAQLSAHAYAQGKDIHVAPGQERHLAHEAWHVVQQKQGRVAATMQMNGGVNVNDSPALEGEADRMGEQASRQARSAAGAVQLYAARPLKYASMGGAVLQPQWAYVDSEAGEHLNLTKTSDPSVFVDSKTGIQYKTTGKLAKNGHVIVEKLASGGQHSDYRYNNFATYQNWTSSASGVTVGTEFGQVGAFHNRGAPKITSKQSDYGNVSLSDKYTDYVTALRSGGKSDADIAKALLSMDDTALASNLEKRGAAMLHVTVYLAEEWRKQGAAKIYRAVLRAIAEGKATFDNFLDYFKFIASADAGRKQVGRFKDIEEGYASPSDLNDDEQIIYEQLSPYNGADYDSDDDLKKEKELKKGRDYSEASGNNKAWHNYS